MGERTFYVSKNVGGDAGDAAEFSADTPVSGAGRSSLIRGGSMRRKTGPVLGRLLGLAVGASLVVTMAALGGLPRTQAQVKTLYVGITLPLRMARCSPSRKPTPAAV
jgi:hypothetical protein